MRKTFIKTLSEISRDNEDIYIVCGDAGFGVFEDFKKEKPDRFINTGVAEANMIGYSAGLAITGFNVFVYNIIPFLLYRCYEQVRNDICYQRLPVTLVGIGSGVTYAPAGMTHYSVEDIALCRSLPNLSIISPIDPIETKAAIEYAVEYNGPLFIRLAKSGELVIRKDESMDITVPHVISEGEDVAIISYGSIFSEALHAVNILKNEGIEPALISLPMIKPINEEAIFDIINGFRAVIILEEHLRYGGLVSILADLFIERGIGARFIPLTLPDAFIHDVNRQAGMRRKYGIDAEGVARTVRSVITDKSQGYLLQNR